MFPNAVQECNISMNPFSKVSGACYSKENCIVNFSFIDRIKLIGSQINLYSKYIRTKIYFPTEGKTKQYTFPNESMLA